MAAFDAGTIVEPLDYKFEYFRDEDGRPLPNGTVREPTDQQIADYLAAVKTMTARYRPMLAGGGRTAPGTALAIPGSDADFDDPAELVAAAEDLDPQTVVTVHDEMAGIYAALCSGEPSKATLLRLPIRVRVLFYSWLQTEVMSPEAAPGAGTSRARTR